MCLTTSAYGYAKYSWLHYVESTDTVFCYFCMVAEKLKLPISKNKDLAFSVNSFCKWKNATSKFEKHQASVSHRQSIDALDTRETTKDVGELIHAGLLKKRAESRQASMAIISNVRYLARQGLALRGRHKKTEKCEDDLGEIDSNFIQLFKLRANNIPCLGPWMPKSQDIFTSPEIQNELVSILAMTILRQIVDNIRGMWYTIMIDKTTDLTNTEQMIFCLRYVDDEVENTSSETIVSTVKDILLRLNLTFEVSDILGIIRTAWGKGAPGAHCSHVCSFPRISRTLYH